MHIRNRLPSAEKIFRTSLTLFWMFVVAMSGVPINWFAPRVEIVPQVQAVTQTFTTSGTWTAPAGVTSVTAEVWGGGGAGGGASGNPATGGGGAGGAYAKGTVTVTPGNNYTYTVGGTKAGSTTANAATNTGNPSWFSTTGTVYAPGGPGGTPASANSTNGAAGTGTSTGAIGNVQVYAGGSGSTGTFTSGVGGSGAGGGGAGSTGAGGNASGTTGGTGTSLNGGNGADGVGNSSAGAAGSIYGGGGSGGKANNNTDRAGGAGAAGLVRLTYNSAPGFSDDPTDTPDPVEVGEVVTFAGTATDTESNTWKLAVCKTNSITPGTTPACASGETLCVSTSAVASGAENTCTWTSTGSTSQAWYAFACDSDSTNPLCSSANTTNSPVTLNPAIDYEQEGFRFREDDGSETTATWLANQDTGITQDQHITTRLRMLVNTTGDAPSNNYQLEYKISTDSAYVPVEQPGASGPTPVIESVSTGTSGATDITAHSITMPSGITAGDLLIIIFSVDGAPGSDPDTGDSRIDTGNWIRLDITSATAVAGAVFYKFAEGSDTASVTTNTGEQSSHVVYRISGAGVPRSHSATGTTANTDPPTLTTVTDNNKLWIAARSGDAQVVATAAPSGYTDLQTVTADGASGASTNTAVSSGAVASEDPGAFTSAAEDWVAFTIAVPPDSMGIDGQGTAVNSASQFVNVPYPGDIAAGDLLVMTIANKYPTDNPVSAPVGWTLPTGGQNYGGAGLINTDDAGEIYASVYVKEAVGTETGSQTVFAPQPNALSGRMFSVRKKEGTTWEYAATGGADTSPGEQWSVTGGSDPGIEAGDLIIVCTGINTDGNTYTVPAMAATGVTFGWNHQLIEQATGNGNDQTLVVSQHGAVSGTSSAAPVFTLWSSSTGTASAPAGASTMLRIRQVGGGGDAEAPIILHDSPNIATSGANTTFQLTAPSGKTTSDFVTGRMQDDENPADAINITTDDYTELEWSMHATGYANDGDVFQFRVTIDGTVLDTYTVTPEWTIGTPGGASPTFTLAAYRWYVDNNSENVTDPWGSPDLAANTLIGLVPAAMNSPPVTSDELRLRVGITVNTNALTGSTQQFKLQYKAGTDASCTTGSWTDMAAGGAGGIWRYATSGVTDGTTLTNIRLTSTSDVLQVYVKANPTTTNPNSATAGQDIEYDFHIQHNGANDAATYSFRVVESDDTVFDAYTACPTLMTAPGTAQLMRHGEVFAEESERGKTWAN